MLNKIEPVTLIGRLIRLEPISESHVADLASMGLDPDIWRLMRYGEMRSADDIRAWVLHLLELEKRGTDLPFAVIHHELNRAIGATRFLNIDPANDSLEIGGTWYAKEFQGTGVNPEAKYLLLRHAFETLDCRRVQFKADARNLRSQKAIERLGAVKEGVLRQHMVLPDGTVRDSVFYSILAQEWPQVKSDLERRINQLLGQPGL